MIKVLTTLSNNSAEGVTSTGLLKTPLALSGTLQVVEDYAGTDSPLYLSTTQVGITTTTPTGNNLSTLTITGATTGGNYLNIIGANGDLYVGVSRSDGLDFSVPAYSSVIATNNFATGLAFATQGVARAYITATGNVGIGTTSISAMHTGQVLQIGSDGALEATSGGINLVNNGVGSAVLLRFGGSASGGNNWYIRSDGNGFGARWYTSAVGQIAHFPTYLSNIVFGADEGNAGTDAMLQIVPRALKVGLSVKGASATDIARFYTSGGSTYAKFTDDGGLTLPLNTILSTTNLLCDQINDNGNLKTVLRFGNYGGYSNTDFIINTTNATITIGAAITQYQFLKFDTAMTAGANNQTMIGMRINATFADNSKTGLTKYIQEWAVAGSQMGYINSIGLLRSTGYQVLGDNRIIGTSTTTNTAGGSSYIQDGNGYAMQRIDNSFGWNLDLYNSGYFNALHVSISGNVGIGTTSPTTNLDIVAQGGAAANIRLYSVGLALGGLGFVSSDNNLYLTNYTASGGLSTIGKGIVINTSGNVGIGTTSPTAQLDVVAASATVGLYVKGAASTDIARFYQSDGTTLGTSILSSGAIRINYDGTEAIPALQIGTSEVGINGFGYANNNTLRLICGGGYALNLASHGIKQKYWGGSGTEFSFSAANGAGANAGASYLYLNAGYGTGTGIGGDIIFQSSVAGSSSSSVNPAVELMRIKSTGLIGIRTTSPTAQLDIVASSSTVGLYVKGAASTDIARFYDSSGAIMFSIDGNYPKVNIGVMRFEQSINYIKSAGQQNVFNFTNTWLGIFEASEPASAVLSASSTTRGFLPPRMTTTQKNAIASPAAGLVIFDTTLAKLCVFTTAWETITSV